MLYAVGWINELPRPQSLHLENGYINGPSTEQVLSKKFFSSLCLAPMLCSEWVARLGCIPSLLPVLTLTSSWVLSGAGRKGLTWVDILEQGLPDGVLQGARVLGGREVFVSQIGLMDFPFKPGRKTKEQAALGAGFWSQPWGPYSLLQGD